MVTVEQDGKKRKMSAAQAFILQLTRRGMQGDSVAAHAAMNAIDEARARHQLCEDENAIYLHYSDVQSGSVNTVFLHLKMAKKLNQFGPSPRILLEPWLVKAALVRFGDRQLSVEEQREVWGATRTPNKVEWPTWWTERRGTRRTRPPREKPWWEHEI